MAVTLRLGLVSFHSFKLYSDASWGDVFNPDEVAIVIFDYWCNEQLHIDIVSKETFALANVLAAFFDRIRNSRADV